MSNEQLEKGLQASVKIYTMAQAKLATLGREAGAECVLSRAEIVDIKKAVRGDEPRADGAGARIARRARTA